MKIRIGTRKSKLALIQSEMAANALRRAFPDITTEFVYITTKGDIVLDRPLEKLGGKGVFIDEIERALTDGEIDIAVHSAKDLPLDIAAETCIAAVLERADPHDVLVTRKGEELSVSPVIGTSSTRRAVGVKKIYPGARMTDIRGNVDTRLNKLADGGYDAIVLAAAGLSRLGVLSSDRFDFLPLSMETIVPAPCQGIIAVQSRRGKIADMLKTIGSTDTFLCFETERRVLELLNAGCSSPCGAYARKENNRMLLTVTKDQKLILTGNSDISERSVLAERLVKSL